MNTRRWDHWAHPGGCLPQALCPIGSSDRPVAVRADGMSSTLTLTPLARWRPSLAEHSEDFSGTNNSEFLN